MGTTSTVSKGSGPTCPDTAPSGTMHPSGGAPCTSRQYSCQAGPSAGESLPTPLQIKLPPWVAQVHRTMGDLQLEGGEMVADLSVTLGGCRRRQVCSHCVRRAICPPDQRQVFHHQQHLKGPHLSRRSAKDLPLQSHMIGSKISQRGVEEGS